MYFLQTSAFEFSPDSKGGEKRARRRMLQIHFDAFRIAQHHQNMEAGNGDPVFFQRFLHHPTRAGPRFTHDQGHMGELREGKPFTGHGGLHASCQNNFVLHKWLVMQVRARCRAFHDAKLHGFILDGLFYFLRIAAFQPYAYFWVVAVEQGQQRRQHIPQQQRQRPE